MGGGVFGRNDISGYPGPGKKVVHNLFVIARGVAAGIKERGRERVAGANGTVGEGSEEERMVAETSIDLTHFMAFAG